jgi:hypothetical protein
MEFASDGPPPVLMDATADIAGTLARLRAAEAREAARDKDSIASFCDGLVLQGRLLPVHRGLVRELLERASDDQAVSFTEGEASLSLGHRAALMRLLSHTPPFLMFGEFAPASGDDEPGAGPFQAPPGYQVDPARADLMDRATRLSGKGGMSFTEAVRTLERSAKR